MMTPEATKAQQVKPNPDNERIKHQYRIYLREARQLDEQSLDAVDAALDRFEEHTGRRDFRKFRPDQATAFKRYLGKATNARTGEPLGKSTQVAILSALKAFFLWLAGQPGYKSKLRYDWAHYFNAPLKTIEVAKARRPPRVPTLDQINLVLATMRSDAAVELRNRAVVAFTILTGARDNAIASLRLKHVDVAERVLVQDGRDVRTKFGKSFETWFFQVGGDAEQIVRDWVAYLTEVLGYGPEDALFPSTVTGFDELGNPKPLTLSRTCWSSAAPIRAIFRDAFKAAGLPYFNPHSFRSTLTRLGMERCAGDAVALKSWSQNLGHDDMLTTLTSYGEVPTHRQRDIILGVGAESAEAKRMAEYARVAVDAALRERLG
jgi:integrase